MGFTSDNFSFDEETSPMLDEDLLDQCPKLWETCLENPLLLVEGISHTPHSHSLGFLSPPKEKQLGGKTNKTPLPRHTVMVDKSKLRSGVHFKSMSAFVCGYDRITREKMEIERIENVEIFQKEVSRSEVQYFAIFDHLIIKESSHNYGQQLFLRFKLEMNTHEVYCIESCPFETISKRGVEKNLKKEYFKVEEKKKEKEILKIEPTLGFRGSLVKIYIKNLEKDDCLFIYIGKKRRRLIF
jgi:hypothetical protein